MVWGLVAKPFCFPLSENIFIFLSFLKDTFPGLEFVVDSSFLSAFEKYCATSFCPPWFQMKNPLSFGGFELVFPNRPCVISLWLLSRIWFVFGFQKFNYDVSWHGFLWVYSVCPASWVYRFVSLAMFEEFSATNSLKNISAPLSSAFIRGLWWCECWIFCYYPPHPGGSAHFFPTFSPLFQLGEINLFVLEFTDFILYHLLYHWAHPMKFSLNSVISAGSLKKIKTTLIFAKIFYF